MQYGAAIHRVLKTYFDSVNLGRAKTDEELIELFRLDLADAKIQEAYQHELYQQQGIAQLREFLASARTLPSPQVLHTEQSFEIRVGQTLVVGRIDRIDRRPDGSVAIIDYKTGKARDQEDADESLQLSLYAIAAKEKWGYTVGALMFLQPRRERPGHHHPHRDSVAGRSRPRGECRAGNCRGNVRCEAGHPLQFLRVSQSVPGEGEAHSASRGERHHEQARTKPGAVERSPIRKKLRGRFWRPLFYFVPNFLSASFSSLPFSWLPLFLFSLPFFMENVAVVFYCN